MIKDLADILSLFYDRGTFTVVFPACFEDLMGTDANFEMVQSNTLVPMKFIHKANKIKEAWGAIFVHTHIHKEFGDDTILKGKPWGEWRSAIADGADRDAIREGMTPEEKLMMKELLKHGVENPVHISEDVEFHTADLRGNAYDYFLRELCEFPEVALYVNPTKAEMIEVLDGLEDRAIEYNILLD